MDKTNNKNSSLFSALVLIFIQWIAAAPDTVEFEKVVLSGDFYANGANFGDINRDGHVDIISGPFWYAGPGFINQAHAFYEPKIWDIEGGVGTPSSDNFIVYSHDFNADDWPDILIVSHSGGPVYWYANPRNPGETESYWEKHLVHEAFENESAVFRDVTGDGRPELLGNEEGYIGYCEPDWENPTVPWTFHRVSPSGGRQQYYHGMGYGDINSDGRTDIIEKAGWWEHPPSLEGQSWDFHPLGVDIGEPVQMYAYDVDGDGDNDIITSLGAHDWGLAWLEQVRQGENINFIMHRIMGDRSEETIYGVAFSQVHALDLADFNGDGLQDIVTGKRWYAHGSTGDPEPQEAAVLYWFELTRSPDGEITYTPHLIDDNSGVGVMVVARDINADGHPEILTGNKKGTALFRLTDIPTAVGSLMSSQPQIRWNKIYLKHFLQDGIRGGFVFSANGRRIPVQTGLGTDWVSSCFSSGVYFMKKGE